MTLNKQILITFNLLVISIILFGTTELDIFIQDFFYHFDTKTWLLFPWDEPYNFIFYTGIKKLLIVIGVLFLITLTFYKKSQLINSYKKGILIVVLSAIAVPGTVGLLKDHTNMPCPRDEIRYNGLYPRTAVWEIYPQEIKALGQTKCWPAGHASGGFALMSLFFLFKKRSNRLIGLGIGLVAGWSMGTYKMIIGDHFFSHTFITMLLAWLIILISAKILKVDKELENG